MFLQTSYNTLPSFKVSRWSIKRLITWKWYAFTLCIYYAVDFFLQYDTLYLEIQMCDLFPSSKTKSIILHNLLNNLSWGRVVYKVLKLYVSIDLAFFFLLMMLTFSMAGSTFWSTQNLLYLERNLDIRWKCYEPRTYWTFM